MKPTIGRIVHYQLTARDAEAINRRRRHAEDNMAEIRLRQTGYQAHVGNKVNAGVSVPMIVTAVWAGDLVNGQVFLDGNDTFWVMSAPQGGEEGQWEWPRFNDGR